MSDVLRNVFYLCVCVCSIHLTCWLDVDQLRRTSQKDKVTRAERSKDIKTKYLTRKYLF